MVVTFGTEGRTVGELRDVIRRTGAGCVLDVRLTPGGKEWGADALPAALPVPYEHVRELACRTLPSRLAAGDAPVFVDLPRGLRKASRRFAETSTVLLLGNAVDERHDARGWLADGYARELRGVIVQHDKAATRPMQESLL